jgi:DNA replication protein DnaC
MKNQCRIGLELNLKELSLTSFLKNYDKISVDIINENLSSEHYLYRLSQLEVEERRNRRIQNLLKGAKFPLQKTLSEFNFDEVPTIKKEVLLELAEGNFIPDCKNIVLYGPPGVGKTHLSIALGRELCFKGYRVLFITACELVQQLIKAKNELALSQFFKRHRKYHLVCIDELGFIPFNKTEADLLFQFISERYERGSLLVTTNLVFSEWGNIFKDATTTAAVVDRLIHHCVILECNSDSYRSKEARKRLTELKGIDT